MMMTYAEHIDEMERVRKRVFVFLDAIESCTEDFDDLCDCEPTFGVHAADCMTLQWRADVDELKHFFCTPALEKGAQ